MDVLGVHVCAPVRKMCLLARVYDSHSYSASYKPIPKGDICHETLHINSSVLGPHSVSRKVSAAIVERLAKANPGLEVTYRDLTTTPLAHLTGSHLAAGQGAPTRARCSRTSRRARPCWRSFSPPTSSCSARPCTISPFRASSRPGSTASWSAGKTFKYSQQGVEGLAGNKRVIVAISRGGFYGAGTPAAVGEHLETYLRWVFGFIGVKNPEFISADGIQVGPEHREKAVAGALQAAGNLERRVRGGNIASAAQRRRASPRSDQSVRTRSPARPGSREQRDQQAETGKQRD